MARERGASWGAGFSCDESETLTVARQTVSCYQLVPVAGKISDWPVLNVTDRSSFCLLFPNIFCGLFSRGTCDIFSMEV